MLVDVGNPPKEEEEAPAEAEVLPASVRRNRKVLVAYTEEIWNNTMGVVEVVGNTTSGYSSLDSAEGAAPQVDY